MKNRYKILVTSGLALASLGVVNGATISNGGFEAGLMDPTGITFPFLDEWYTFSGSANANATLSTTTVRTGTSSLAVTIQGDDSSFAGVFQDLPVIGGVESVNLEGYYSSTVPQGVALEMRVEWRNASGGEISRETQDGANPGTGFSMFSLSTGVSPADAVAARVVFAVQTFGGEPDPGNDGTVFFDDVSVVTVPEPTSSLLAGLSVLGLMSRRRR